MGFETEQMEVSIRACSRPGRFIQRPKNREAEEEEGQERGRRIANLRQRVRDQLST